MKRFQPDFRLRSEWLAALPTPPASPPLEKKLLRTLILIVVGGLIGLLALAIITRAFPLNSTPGHLLYSFHDEILLRIWGYTWRKPYPWSLALWISAATIWGTFLWVWLSDKPVTRALHVRLQRWTVASPKIWVLVLPLMVWTERWRRKSERHYNHGQLREVAEVEWQRILAIMIRSRDHPPLEFTRRFVQLVKVRLDLLVICPVREPDWFSAAALWHTAVLHLEAGGTPEMVHELQSRGTNIANNIQRDASKGEHLAGFSEGQLARDFVACVALREDRGKHDCAAEKKALNAAVAGRLIALEQVLLRMGGSRYRVLHSTLSLWSTIVPTDAIAAPLAVTVALEVAQQNANPEIAGRTIELMDALLLAARLQQRTGTAPREVTQLVEGWAGRVPSTWHRRLVVDRVEQAAKERWGESGQADYEEATRPSKDDDGVPNDGTGFSPWQCARQRIAFLRTQAAQRTEPPRLKP